MTGWRLALTLAGLAAALTLADAVKPLHIDDPFIYRVAEQMAEKPTDPYGFDVFWYQWPQPLIEELTPPVLPYALSLALDLFGDSPVASKLWLFPFALLFTVATHELLRRFAPGLELALTALTVLSPTFLPSLNLMQDVPAQALGLGALALYLRAADRGSLGLALAAGVIAGLAHQTKYVTLTIPAAILLDAVLRRRVRPALVTIGTALALFAGWEWLMTLRYGSGMFLGQVRFELFWVPRASMVWPLVQLLGGTLSVPALIVLAASGVSSRLTLALAAAVAAGFGLLVAFPVQSWLYGILGALVVSALTWAAIGLLRLDERRETAFLLLWLAVELLGYFATAPFPAVRRVMGLVIVATLIAGSRAARSRRAGTGIPLGRLVALGAGLGLLVAGVDWVEARAERQAATLAAAAVRSTDPAATIWFTGHWGFQHYAERAGMQPLIPDYSVMRAGDYLVVPSRVDQQRITLSRDQAERFHRLSIGSSARLVTKFGFYAGSTVLEHHAGPRMEVGIFRIVRDGVAVTAWPLDELAGWALRAGGRAAGWATAALVGWLEDADPAARRTAAAALEALGPRAAAATGALTRALDDPDPGVRDAAARALDRIRAGARL